MIKIRKNWKLKLYLAALPLILMLSFTVPIVRQTPLHAQAYDPAKDLCTGTSSSQVIDKRTGKLTCSSGGKSATELIFIVINTLIFLVGTGSVFMIIYAAMVYVTSQGEQAQITKAKNTIIYSVVGIIIAISAYAIVNFVATTV